MPNDKPMTLDDFAESLLREKNYTTLTDGMAKELKEDIKQRAQDFLMAKTIAKLSNEQIQELDKLLDKNPESQELQDFIAKCIPDSTVFIGDTLFEFRNKFLGLV
jgi:hypothetical protein